MKKLFFATITAAFTFFVVSCMQPKTTLKLNLQKGDKFLYEATTDSKSSTEMMGKKMDQHQQGKVSYTMEVTGKNADSSMNLNCVLSDISMKVDGTDNGSPDDTTSTQARMNKMMKAMRGLTFEMTMAENGEIKSVKGADNMFDTILSSLPEEMNSQKDQMKEIMKQYVGEDALKESFKSFHVYPDHPVAVGDEWTNSFKMKMMGMQMNNIYKLKADSSNNALINCTGKMVNDSTAAPTEMMGMKMKYNLSGDETGTMTLNTNTGLLNDVNLDQKVAGKMEMSGGQLPEPMSLPMTIENIITVKVTKIQN